MKINPIIYLAGLSILLTSCEIRPDVDRSQFEIPAEYLVEAENIPAFWVASIDEVNDFIVNNVRKGSYYQAGVSAGGRAVYAVCYGEPRAGSGTTTYSGALSAGGMDAYRGPDNSKTVYMAAAGIHGIELEGIMGMVNLISVFETGADLNGVAWPELASLADSVDRIVLIPLVNPDGRARLPIRMESHKGHHPDAYLCHEYLNTGGRHGGQLIGWPEVKEFIPMDFSQFAFPGGYPNDNGVNIMHDDFFGTRQPETQMLFDMAAREKPDLILNMHTGVPRENYFMSLLKPDCESALYPVWAELYRSVHGGLTARGLRKTTDPERECDPSRVKISGLRNLNTALNFHCGALCVTVEDTSHGYSGVYENGDPVEVTPQKILRSELTAHREALRFLSRTGGRSQWEKQN